MDYKLKRQAVTARLATMVATVDTTTEEAFKRRRLKTDPYSKQLRIARQRMFKNPTVRMAQKKKNQLNYRKNKAKIKLRNKRYSKWRANQSY